MDFDLSGLPEELQSFIRTALQGRRKALLTAETEIKAALQESINRIRERIGKRGVFTGITQELAERIAEEKVFFASELERITQEGLTRAAYAGLFVGEQTKRYYKEKGLLKFRLIEKDALREAEVIAESTMRKQRIFKNKKFVLSDRIWDLSDNNYEKIQEIIASGINRLSLLSSAQGKPYDNIRHSCFFIGTYVYRKNKIYFRFTPSLKVEPDLSIYESESDEDIAHIIKEELYHWLHEKTSIVHGYFDIYEMMRTGKIISVKEHKKMEDCEIRYYGSYSEPIVP